MSRAEGFAAVPTWMIRDTTVSVHAIAVFASLASRAGLKDIRPAQATLAAEARCSDRQVRRALVELEQLGVVRRKLITKGVQGRGTNAYTLHPNGTAEVADSQSGTWEVADRDAEVADSQSGGSGHSEQPTPLIEVDTSVDRSEVDSAPRKRGSRIPDPFIVTAEMRAWAADEAPGLNVDQHTREFVDHWRAATGQSASKRDWVAAWRNWMRKAHRWQPGSRATFAQQKQTNALSLVARYMEEESREEVGTVEAARFQALDRGR